MAAAKAPATKPRTRAPKVKAPPVSTDALDEAFNAVGDTIDRDAATFLAMGSRSGGTRAEAGGPPAEPVTPASEPTTAKRSYSIRPPQFGSPSLGGMSTTLGSGYDRKQSSRIIILAVGVGAAAIIIGGSKIPAYAVHAKDSSGKDVTALVPGNMRAFAGIVVAGTVALIINELSPDLGMLFAVSLIFIAIADVKVFTSFGDALFGKGTHAPTPSQPALPKGQPAQPVPPSQRGSGGGSW